MADRERRRTECDTVREAPQEPDIMKIEHVALWISDLERVRAFYETYFGATAGPKYTNAAKGFESYFLTFPSGGARLELMRRSGQPVRPPGAEHTGWAHLAFSVGSVEAVDALTERLRAGSRWSMARGGPGTGTTRAWSSTRRATGSR
jgi:lactoylglutathione lyase